MRILILMTTLLMTFLAQGQSKGVITGVLSDKDMNNEPLPFANVMIKGTTIGATTDENGKYTVSVPAGTYTVVFSFLGYESASVPVTVKAGETVKLNKALGAGSVQIEEVVITTTRRKNTESAVMLEVKEAKQVVSAISAEQMAKGTDGNAAQAIQRVPGVTIVDGKFVMIRGLSERYNNVLLNGSVAPSTEVDKRTFSFDLIPTSSLDKMIIYKTGSADKPGDFAGGIIEITTSENTSEFTKADVSFGYRANTSFSEYQQSKGSKTDILGFDNSYRPLPSDFPTRDVINGNPAASVQAAHSLPNNFNPESSQAFFDMGSGFSLGRNIKLKSGRKISTTNALSYSNSYQYYKREFNRYFTLNAGEVRPQQWLKFSDDTYQNKTRITALSNWIFRTNENNVFKFKNLFNQIGENETIIRNGFNFQQRGNDDLRNYLLGYRNRTIYTGQLQGDHKLNSTNKIDWVIGYNHMSEKEPDLRRFRTFRPEGETNSNYTIIDPASSNLFDTGRYFGNLAEYSFNNGANYTHTIERIKGDEEFAPYKIKSGYYADYRNREFDSRYVSYFLSSFITPERGNELKQMPLSQMFNPANINTTDGWVLKEGTRSIDSYKASNTLVAGYAMAEIPIKKFDITTGVRVEHNILEMKAKDDLGPINVSNPVTSVLPSVNIGYNINEKNVTRVAYSKTVNRPEFREIAPFLFYDYQNDAAKVGNPKLETATIDNLDIRYEYYPRKGETVSLGGFYKLFDKPIENVVQITTEQPQFLYANAKNAYNYGAELELRKSLSNSSIPFISRLSANVNASYIFSKVDLGKVTSQDRNRPLQGQSPYIINVAISYDDEKKGISVNLIYNRFGDRIFAVGDVIFPTIYELSRDHLDMSISKKFKHINYKLGIQDLLNAQYRFYEDSNRDSKITMDKDNVISSFKRGTLFNMNISYNF
jgi:TonB-dependent receptor